MKNCRPDEYQYLGSYDLNFMIQLHNEAGEYHLCAVTAITDEYTEFRVLYKSKHQYKVDDKYREMKTNEKLVSDLYLSNLTIAELESLKPSLFETIIDMRIKELQDAAKANESTEDTTA